MVRVPHPPYSQDRAPSDFFLFGYLKSMLKGRHFETEEELLAAMLHRPGTIEKVISVPMMNMSEGMNKRLRIGNVLFGGNRYANRFPNTRSMANSSTQTTLCSGPHSRGVCRSHRKDDSSPSEQVIQGFSTQNNLVMNSFRVGPGGLRESRVVMNYFLSLHPWRQPGAIKHQGNDR
jgi:hypothetical protein